MTRKSPYRHPVSGHYREGKFVDHYMRGEGKKPSGKLPQNRVKPVPKKKYKVTVYYPGADREAQEVDAGNLTEAVAAGTSQAKELPKRVKLKQVKK